MVIIIHFHLQKPGFEPIGNTSGGSGSCVVPAKWGGGDAVDEEEANINPFTRARRGLDEEVEGF